MDRKTKREFVTLGAKMRLREIAAERKAILSTFPKLEDEIEKERVAEHMALMRAARKPRKARRTAR